MTLLGAAAAVLFATLVGAGSALADTASNWATGAELKSLLAQPVGPGGITWSASPLRQALGDLSQAKRLAILIDRRVDPGQLLKLQLQNVSLEAALELIARDRQLGVSQFGPVSYFGPPTVASRLRTIAALRAEDARRFPATAARRYLLAERMKWADFATPRELLTSLAEQNRLTILGLDRVPHDLWAAADLPPLSLVDRLTLILVQFDLTFQVSSDGKTITLVPVPDDVAIVRSYPGGRQPKSVADRYAALVPDARIKVVGNKVYVKGLLEDHEQLAASRVPSVHPGDQPTNDIQTTRIDKLSVTEMPVQRLLDELAKRLKLQLVIDHRALQQAGVSLQRPVSLSVTDVSVDELLRELAKHTGLRLRRRGALLEVGPGSK
jgi:hypothetical protein